MAGVDADAVRRMTGTLFIERGIRSPGSTRFWGLLVLAAVIASAGVVGDSTATVIGAMIVAPLMTPILGCALALVLARRRQVTRCLLLVTGGALAVVAIGLLLGWIVTPPDAYASNSQVSSRISPRLIDLLAALATGTVGAFALVRADISDTLPGVAIAISLVPPLAVTGLLLTVHRYHDAGQSALLFATNVAAIVATGTVVFLIYGVRAEPRGRTCGWGVPRQNARRGGVRGRARRGTAHRGHRHRRPGPLAGRRRQAGRGEVGRHREMADRVRRGPQRHRRDRRTRAPPAARADRAARRSRRARHARRRPRTPSGRRPHSVVPRGHGHLHCTRGRAQLTPSRRPGAGAGGPVRSRDRSGSGPNRGGRP